MFTLTIQDSNGQVVAQVSFEQGTYTIGRMESCDITLNSTSVSRQHAKLFIQNGRCFIEDAGSANGVVVDGQRVVGQRDLGTASQIQLGDFYLFLEFQRQGLSNEQRVLQTMFIPRDSDHHKIVRIYDSFAGEEFVLSEVENTIGRTDENFILLSDASISRHHAKILRDGEKHRVVDLGSSNGTSINHKPVNGQVAVRDGDILTFGNLSFVFAAGDTKLDARSYSPPERDNSKFIQFAGIGVVALLSLAVGACIVFAMYKYKQSKDTPKAPVQIVAPTTDQDPVKTEEDKLLAKAKRAMSRKEWDVALASTKDLLALKPDMEVAKALKAQIIKEREASAQLEVAEGLIERGKHQDAKLLLEKIDSETKAYERAQTALERTNDTLAYNYKNEAVRLISRKRKRDLKRAHGQFIKALNLTPHDDDLIKRVRALEKKLKRKRVKFTAYAAP